MRLLLVLLLLSPALHAQQTLTLDNTFHNTHYTRALKCVPVFRMKHDTLVLDMSEGKQKAEYYKVRLPALEGAGDTGYCFLYFGGNHSPATRGYVPVLVHNAYGYGKTPELYVDQNHNLDFTDDGPPLLFPFIQTELTITLRNPADTPATLYYHLSRFSIIGRDNYRDMLQKFYSEQEQSRPFMGIRCAFREQRSNSRGTLFFAGKDTFLVGLNDVNCNGLYYEPGIDQVVLVSVNEKLILPTEEMDGATVLEKKEQLLECRQRQFALLQVDPYGHELTLKEIASPELRHVLKPGTKAPKVTFRLADDSKLRLNRLRRKQVYLYFTRFSYEGFKADTAALIHLQQKYGDRLRIVYLLYGDNPNKLRILAGFPGVNWYMAYTDRKLNAQFYVAEFPSGVLLEKRRRVKAVDVTLAELEKLLDATH